MSKAQRKLIGLISNKGLAPIVGATLAEIAVELTDAKEEARHWKRSFETVATEMKVAIAVMLKQQRKSRLVVTKAELAEVGEDQVLYTSTPEPGVRIYELRDRNATHVQAETPGGLIHLN